MFNKYNEPRKTIFNEHIRIIRLGFLRSINSNCFINLFLLEKKFNYLIFINLIIFIQIDDVEFNIPKVSEIPSVESILNDEDVSLLSEDDLTVYQNKVNTYK